MSEPSFDAWIAKARAVPIEAELARRGVALQGRGPERAGPCPVCGGVDRFSINVKKQFWHCRGCKKGGDVIALVQHVGNESFHEAVEFLAGEASGPPARAVETSRRRDDHADQITRDVAAIVWRTAIDPRGTLVEPYLRSRGLDLPIEAAGEAIRFHDRCKFGDEWRPAMICLVRNIVTNEPQGVHRTALAQNATAIKRAGKTLRMSLGQIAGGAIKLDPDETVEQGLCIGEGVETCLSGRQMGLKPVWSAVNTAGITSFPVLPGVEGLHLFKEHDTNGASEKAVKQCASRWYEAGRSVFIVTPDSGKDLNDELREAV